MRKKFETVRERGGERGGLNDKGETNRKVNGRFLNSRSRYLQRPKFKIEMNQQ